MTYVDDKDIQELLDAEATYIEDKTGLVLTLSVEVLSLRNWAKKYHRRVHAGSSMDNSGPFPQCPYFPCRVVNEYTE